MRALPQLNPRLLVIRNPLISDGQKLTRFSPDMPGCLLTKSAAIPPLRDSQDQDKVNGRMSIRKDTVPDANQ